MENYIFKTDLMCFSITETAYFIFLLRNFFIQSNSFTTINLKGNIFLEYVMTPLKKLNFMVDYQGSITKTVRWKPKGKTRN